jgi:hypothetical protein
MVWRRVTSGRREVRVRKAVREGDVPEEVIVGAGCGTVILGRTGTTIGVVVVATAVEVETGAGGGSIIPPPPPPPPPPPLGGEY